MYELYELRGFTESRGTTILKLYMYFQVLRRHTMMGLMAA